MMPNNQQRKKQVNFYLFIHYSYAQFRACVWVSNTLSWIYLMVSCHVTDDVFCLCKVYCINSNTMLDYFVIILSNVVSVVYLEGVDYEREKWKDNRKRFNWFTWWVLFQVHSGSSKLEADNILTIYKVRIIFLILMGDKHRQC